MKAFEILLAVFSCVGVGYYCGLNASDKELQELQIKKAKLSIELLKKDLTISVKKEPIKDFLTVDDIDSIYGCVRTMIENQHNKVKFPCTAVRGETSH